MTTKAFYIRRHFATHITFYVEAESEDEAVLKACKFKDFSYIETCEHLVKNLKPYPVTRPDLVMEVDKGTKDGDPFELKS